jgi:1-acyl-sn-glycerol-3-phosphate acyltransferase
MKPTAKLSFKITAAILVPLIKAIVRLEIRGRGNLPPAGAIIAICNHIHLFDPIIHIMSILPRDSIFLAKEELFRPWPIPLFAILMKVTDALRVPRRGTNEERKEVMEKSLMVLVEGHVLGIYPEGTRSGTGKLDLAHPGAVRLALRSGAPLIPISIYGTEKIKGIGWITRPKVVVTFGKPFYLPKLDREPSFTRIQELSNLIMGQLCNVLPPEYHGKYSKQAAQPQDYSTSSIKLEGEKQEA